MVQLNKKEFNDKIFTRINNLIHDYNLINEHELIAVALSGGKDKKRADDCIKYGIIDTAIVTLIITALFEIFANPLSKLFGF